MSKAGVAKTQEHRKPRKRKRVKLEERVINGVVVVGKECTKCGEWKELVSGFYVKKDCIGGRDTQCKVCKKRKSIEWYEENKERHAETCHMWREKNVGKKKALNRRWYEKNKEKVLESNKKRYEENKESVKEYKSIWYEKNKERHNENSRKWREENRERVAELKRIWSKNNPDKVNLSSQKRRARKKALPDDFTTKQLNEVLTQFKCGCAITGSADIHLDHAIPLEVGHGGTTYGNMIPLRSDLNFSKNDSNIFEWFEANRQRFELSQDKFDRLIEWLAAANDMTVEEYRDYVYWCHANPVDVLESEAI